MKKIKRNPDELRAGYKRSDFKTLERGKYYKRLGTRLTKAQREELERRLDEMEREGRRVISWEEVLRQNRGRRR